MKDRKKWGAWVFVLTLVLGILGTPTEGEAAGGKIVLNKTKAVLMEGESVQLRLKHVPEGRAVRWSSSQKSVAAVSGKGMVTAKKAGKAKITAAVGKKKYHCAVTVKKFALTHTENKNASEVKALTQMIRKQNAKGAVLSTDLNKKEQYVWNARGRLESLDWFDKGLSGSLSLKEFPFLKTLNCGSNQLSSLDVSNNASLCSLDCSYNFITTLNMGNKEELTSLNCKYNQLSSLNVSGCAGLEYLYCGNNRLSSLDVGKNPALKLLDCLSNQLGSLDVSKNPLLDTLCCDETVTVTGYTGGIYFYGAKKGSGIAYRGLLAAGVLTIVI